MEIWFSQKDTENVKTSVRVDKQLFSSQSEYQRIDVFQSQEFGRMIVLDGEIIFPKPMNLFITKWWCMCRWRCIRMSAMC